MRRSTSGIAVCAAIALTCVFAPAHASATVLCAKQVTPCTSVWGAGTQIKAALPKMTTTVIENEFANVTCLENKIGMKTTAAGGGGFLTVPARVFELEFNQCTVPDGMGKTENCTVKAINLGANEEEQYLGIFEKGKNGNGEFGISSSNLGPPGFSVLCNEKVERFNCSLTNATTTMVTGGSLATTPATITGAQKMKPVAGGKKCPAKEPTWKFTWAVSGPDPFYMESE